MTKISEYIAREEKCRALAEVYANRSTRESFKAAAEAWKYLRELEEDARSPRALDPYPRMGD